MEEKQMKIEQQLRQCNRDQIAAVATGLAIAFGEEDTARNILRRVQEGFDDASEEEKSKLFLAIVPLVPSAISMKVMEILLDRGEETTRRRSDGNTSIQDVTTILQAIGLEPGATNSTLRREFKITGTIGTTSQKDHITYINLCGQIEDGKSKGYTDEEISQAVRKSVSPGNELRTVLDAKTDMSLEVMLQFVRGFLQEKTAAELYKDLNNMFQKEDESPQTFVLRAMGIREKIIKASATEPEGALRYDDQLIHNMFLHTIRTGLKDIAVKSEVKELLRQGTGDADILTALNTAALEEEQRKMKRSDATRRRAAVNEMHTSVGEASDQDVGTASGGSNAGVASVELADSMKQLLQEVSAMRKEIDEMRGNKKRMNVNAQTFKPTKKFQKKGCKNCEDRGWSNSCRHCWNCGADDHFSHNCRTPPLN